MEQPLTATIENLYRVFGRYPLRKHVEGCPCCVHNEDKRLLESKPLRQLPWENLSRYAFKAMTTWGDQEDFKHFFPRIFELLIGIDGIGWDTETILGKLALAEWTSWKDVEQMAVRDFFRAVWNCLLKDKGARIEPDSWLCGMSRAGEDLQTYLDDWVSARSASAYEHLVKFVEHHEPAYIKKHSLSNPFWPACPDGVKQVCDWAANPEIRKELEKIYFENDSAVYAAALSEVIQRLEWIASA